MPRVAEHEFDPNNASEVTRVSPTELIVITTAYNRTELRFVAV